VQGEKSRFNDYFLQINVVQQSDSIKFFEGNSIPKYL
jgi:hypothetical protein